MAVLRLTRNQPYTHGLFPLHTARGTLAREKQQRCQCRAKWPLASLPLQRKACAGRCSERNCWGPPGIPAWHWLSFCGCKIHKMSSPFKNLRAPPTLKGTTYRGSRTTTDACHLNEKNIICKDETSTCGDLEKSTGKRRGVTTTAQWTVRKHRNAALRREGSLAGAPEPGGAPRPGPLHPSAAARGDCSSGLSFLCSEMVATTTKWPSSQACGED